MIVIIRKEVRMTTRTTELFSRVNFFFTNSLAWNSSRTHCKRNEGRNKTYSRVFLLFLSLFLLQSLNLYYKRPPPPALRLIGAGCEPRGVALGFGDGFAALPALFVCLFGRRFAFVSHSRAHGGGRGRGGGRRERIRCGQIRKEKKKSKSKLSY